MTSIYSGKAFIELLKSQMSEIKIEADLKDTNIGDHIWVMHPAHNEKFECVIVNRTTPFSYENEHKVTDKTRLILVSRVGDANSYKL